MMGLFNMPCRDHHQVGGRRNAPYLLLKLQRRGSCSLGSFSSEIWENTERWDHPKVPTCNFRRLREACDRPRTALADSGLDSPTTTVPQSMNSVPNWMAEESLLLGKVSFDKAVSRQSYRCQRAGTAIEDAFRNRIDEVCKTPVPRVLPGKAWGTLQFGSAANIFRWRTAEWADGPVRCPRKSWELEAISVGGLEFLG